MNRFWGFIIFVVLFFLSSCKKQSNEDDINNYLNVKVDNYHVKNCNISRLKLSQDYDLPFFVFISIKIDSVEAYKLFSDLKLVKYNQLYDEKKYKKIMCFHSNNLQSFFKMQPLTYRTALQERVNSIKWWEPDTSIINCYASYYELINSKRGKPVFCNDRFDGRVVAQYSNETAYILIECFMR